MKKYIECEAVKEKLRPAVNDPDSVDFWEWQCSEIDSIPAADVVARDCYNRILAENDTMREQLAKIGKRPGDSMDNVRSERYARKTKFFNEPWTGNKFTTCTTCYGKVGPRDKFCKHCGAKFEEVNT